MVVVVVGFIVVDITVAVVIGIHLYIIFFGIIIIFTICLIIFTITCIILSVNFDTVHNLGILTNTSKNG